MSKAWQDRNLLTSPIYYALVTSEKKLKKELNRIGSKAELSYPSGDQGRTIFLENTDGSTAAIVMLFNHNFDLEQIYALLVHEAVHIFQKIKEEIGEENPSAEFEAYSIQRIRQNLFYEYKRQRKL